MNTPERGKIAQKLRAEGRLVHVEGSEKNKDWCGQVRLC